MLQTIPAIGPTEYRASDSWGMSTSIDIYDCDPDLIRDPERIGAFARELCDLLDVQRYGDPVIVRFGKDPDVYGYSLVQLIETSLVSAHFAESSNAVYLDVFSCKWYDTEAAVEFARTFFRGARVEVNQTLRR
jgi:S-adenosylmethionine decarboxylase